MPRRTHEDAMRTKKKILAASLDVFSRQGYEKTSLTDIAREAGVTRGAIYWHFEDKSELLCELCKEIANDHGFAINLMEAADSKEIDPLGKLKQWALSHASDNAMQFFASTIITEINNIIHKSDSDPRVAERLDELMESRIFLIKEALRNAITHRQLPRDFDVDAGTMYLVILVTGHSEINISFTNYRRSDVKTRITLFKSIVELAFKTLPLLRIGQENTRFIGVDPYFI